MIKSIINQLKRYRGDKQLSQQHISELMHIPQSQLSKLESGNTDIRLSTLQQWARVLGLELVLVPRELVPGVQALSHGQSQQRPLWQIDETADE